MKVGDVCKCISDFNGELPREIILHKNDFVQIHRIVDKLWLEGEGGGSFGLFPSSAVVKTDVPDHPENTCLYVVVANFEPMQNGDLPLMRGTFVTGLNSIDQDWAYGESYGRKGVFPLNFVWKINEDIMQGVMESEKPKRMKGKVRTSTRSQLPEELDLYAGDIVLITHELEDGWYRGECNGKTGIFPSNFVEIIENDVPEVSDQSCIQDLSKGPSKLTPPDGTEILQVPFEPANHLDSFSLPNVPESCVSESEEQFLITKSEPEKSNQLDKGSKDAYSLEDEDLFNDDYFRVNMPGAYSSASREIDLLCKGTEVFEASQNKSVPNLNDGLNDNASEILIPVDTFSAEVENYLNNESNKTQDKSLIQDLLDIDFAYTEDNTGINPYGRAVFSFAAQYANELSFKKGDIIHLIRHVDSHWTVGKLGIAKGIFPTSYIDIIVDCPHKAEECFERHVDSTTRKAIVCFDYDATSSEDASAKEGDLVLVTKFVSENWVEVETVDGECGLFPMNHLNILGEEDSSLTKEIEEKSSVKTTKRKYEKEDFSLPKENDIESALTKNLSSLDITCKHSKPILSQNTNLNHSFSETHIMKDETAQPLKSKDRSSSRLDKKTGSSHSPHTLVDDIKPSNVPALTLLPLPTKLPSKSNQAEEKPVLPPKPTKHENKKETSVKTDKFVDISSPKRLSLELSFKSTDFPQDISSSSLSQHSDEVHSSESATSELNPKRPAPPPPLRHSDSENEEFYSLPSDGSETNDRVFDEEEDRTPQTRGGGEEEDTKEESSEVPLHRHDTHERKKKLAMRRESVKELMTTEHEYVHDLESLIQVVRTGRVRRDAVSIDFHTLMGNIERVVDCSKHFIKELNTVAFNEDENMLIGPVFIDMAEEMCKVYKTYSANNSIAVAPLLQKYQEGESTKMFLTWVLTELRQHKVNLLDMQAVLIKPVQRVLKYPLFIDNLVHNTPPSHPDYKNLEEARKLMLNVAKEINEHTKRLDLVNKYRQGSHHSFGEMIQRVSMRSVAKKGSRIKTRISTTMGLINKTIDLKFEEEEAKFRALSKAATALAEQGHKLLDAITRRHRSELDIIEYVAYALLRESKVSQIETLRNTCRDTCNRILPFFERITNKRVLEPVRALQSMCSAPEHLMQKRYDKLLDFDKAQHKLDKNRDPSRTRILEEELKGYQGTYEALNQQLLMDLPTLNEHGTEILIMAFRSLVSARMNLEGHVANLYLKLAQLPAFSYLSEEDYLKRFKMDFADMMTSLKRLPFVSAEFTPKSPRFGRWMSLRRRSQARKEEKRMSSIDKGPEKEDLAKRYDSHMLFICTSTYVAEGPLELSLRQGEVVGVIKMKDPLGNSDRWFVDSGGQKGFVKSCSLQRYNGKETDTLSKRGNRPSTNHGSQPADSRGYQPSSQPPSTTNHGSQPADSRGYQASSHPPSTDRQRPTPRHSIPDIPWANLPHADPQQTEGVSMQPPRYEDIFPSFFPPDEQQETNLEGSAENVYEEIDQVRGSRYANIDEPRSEPVYEAIPAEVTEEEDKRVFFPEPDEESPQFYYALYHFGGDGSNQLSLHEGQVVLLLFAQGSDWWFVENREGHRGYVPAAYLVKYT